MDQSKNGHIVWYDLTVPDATRARDFYSAVAGWTPQGMDMGGYEDFGMSTADDEFSTGVCHARGDNAAQPPYWMVYIQVADLDASVAKSIELGGTAIGGTRSFGEGRFQVLQDPAGAYFGLIGD